ncbi:MAG TPA: hypothetical protein VIR57_02310 [Chloroflexota bacterium]
MNSTDQTLAWARTANQRGPAFQALQARIQAGEQVNDLQIAFLRRVQRTATKRAGWAA